jgi:hypothetical protein
MLWATRYDKEGFAMVKKPWIPQGNHQRWYRQQDPIETQLKKTHPINRTRKYCPYLHQPIFLTIGTILQETFLSSQGIVDHTFSLDDACNLANSESFVRLFLIY